MLKGSEIRRADPPWPLFLDRWSPYSMTGEPIREADLRVLLEAEIAFAGPAGPFPADAP